MRTSFLNFILITSCSSFYFLSTGFASYGQGLSEHGALKAGTDALAGNLNNKSVGIPKSSISGKKGFTNGVSNAGPLTDNKRRKFSPEEIKAAAEESNKFYRAGEQKEKAANYDEAKQLYHKSAIARAHVWGFGDPAVAKLTLKIGEIEIKQKHPDEARVWFKRSLTALSKHYGSGDYELVPALSQLAQLETDQKRHEEASSYYEHILLLQEKEFGEENQKCVPVRISLIEEYLAANDLSDADKLAKKAITTEAKERGISSSSYAKLQQLSTQIATLRASNSSK